MSTARWLCTLLVALPMSTAAQSGPPTGFPSPSESVRAYLAGDLPAFAGRAVGHCASNSDWHREAQELLFAQRDFTEEQVRELISPLATLHSLCGDRRATDWVLEQLPRSRDPGVIYAGARVLGDLWGLEARADTVLVALLNSDAAPAQKQLALRSMAPKNGRTHVDLFFFALDTMEDPGPTLSGYPGTMAHNATADEFTQRAAERLADDDRVPQEWLIRHMLYAATPLAGQPRQMTEESAQLYLAALESRAETNEQVAEILAEFRKRNGGG